jgi:hypothetical protein
VYYWLSCKGYVTKFVYGTYDEAAILNMVKKGRGRVNLNLVSV